MSSNRTIIITRVLDQGEVRRKPLRLTVRSTITKQLLGTLELNEDLGHYIFRADLCRVRPGPVPATSRDEIRAMGLQAHELIELGREVLDLNRRGMP